MEEITFKDRSSLCEYIITTVGKYTSDKDGLCTALDQTYYLPFGKIMYIVATSNDAASFSTSKAHFQAQELQDITGNLIFDAQIRHMHNGNYSILVYTV